MSGVDVHVFRDSVARIVRALTDSNVPVRQQGMRAFVKYDAKGKPEMVNLPSIPDNASPDLLNAIQGFLDHEVSHILHTDFGYAATRQLECKKKGDKTMPALWNVIEDVFIERKMQSRFRGSALNLENVRRYITGKLLREHYEKMKREGADAKAIRSLLLPSAIRAAAGQDAFSKFMSDKWGDLGEHAAAIQGMGKRFAEIDSTKDSWVAAKELYDLIVTPPEKNSDESDNKDKSESKKSSKQKGDGKSSGTQDEDSQSEDNTPDDQDEGSENEKGNSKDKKKAKKDGEGESDEGSTGDPDEPDEGEGEDKNEDQGSEGEESEDGEQDKGEQEEGEGEKSEGEKEEDEEGEDGEGEGDSEGEENEEEEEEEGEGEGEGEDSSEQSSGNAGRDEDEGGDGEMEESQDESDDGEVERDNSGIGSSSPSDAEEERFEDVFEPDGIKPLDDTAAEAIEQAIAEHQACHPNDYVPFTRDYDFVGPLPTAEKFMEWSLDNSTVAKRAAESAHVIQGEVERVFRARSAARWNPGQRRGKINRAALHRIATGDDRVFRTKIETSTKDVAVQLVVDCSGSMWQDKISYAATAAYMLASVLEKVNVNCEVVGFTTLGKPMEGVIDAASWRRFMADYDKAYYDSRGMRASYARYAPTALWVFKDFKQRFDDRAKKTLGFLDSTYEYMGANVDGESIEMAAMRLMQRKEARKIMIVLSDGQPASDGSHKLGVTKLKQVIGDLEKSGVDVYGLGLMDSAVKSYYSKSEVINRADEIPQKILSLLQQLLTQ